MSYRCGTGSAGHGPGKARHRGAAFVARIEPGNIGPIHSDQTEIVNTVSKFLEVPRLRRIARSEAKELLGRLGDKGGYVVVGNPDASQPRFHAENHDLFEWCVVRDELLYPDGEVKGKAAEISASRTVSGRVRLWSQA